jgi:cystathionine beta-lyase/cystathionine gamma-synthase
MARAGATALEMAGRLEDHPGVARVHYPLLPSHPDFDLARRLLPAGGGAMLTIDLETRPRAEAFFRALAGSIPFAPSLGDVQTTLSHPATTSHRGLDEAAMARQGINAGMVRVSIGLEDPEDLWREFRGALEAIGMP